MKLDEIRALIDDAQSAFNQKVAEIKLTGSSEDIAALAEIKALADKLIFAHKVAAVDAYVRAEVGEDRSDLADWLEIETPPFHPAPDKECIWYCDGAWDWCCRVNNSGLVEIIKSPDPEEIKRLTTNNYHAAGWSAYYRGDEMDTNPYPNDGTSKSNDWISGFKAAEEDDF